MFMVKEFTVINAYKRGKRKKGRGSLRTPGIDRWKNRSRTYTGIAAAMVEQWDYNVRMRR